MSHNINKKLYNGIILQEPWPPSNINPESKEPMPVPYLKNIPEVISIDIGRQLFVDDFLIEETDLDRKYHKARKYRYNPIFKPKTDLESKGVLPVAAPKSGGIWWDAEDELFKMWYEAGWLHIMAYAVSENGIDWNRPELDVEPGTNRILPDLSPDSTTVFIDYNAPVNEKFKMFLRSHGGKAKPGNSMVSADGIHWSEPVKTGDCGDRSTMFYNPFRRKWIYSIRNTRELIGNSNRGRSRSYYECDDFIKEAKWDKKDIVFWTGADRLDPPDPEISQPAQLYNLDAVAYESLMLGFYQIHLGPPNDQCGKNPKITELNLAYSRDGFHWHRPDREPFISATRKNGSWDQGYVQSVGGICVVKKNELWFYYIGFSGGENMYANASTGLAKLRRDGFASLETDTKGSITTKLLSFNDKYLFVNTKCNEGELRVEILDKDKNIIKPYSKNNCNPISLDSTCQQITWKNKEGLSSITEEPVHFRFHLENGELYSFWTSSVKSGASNGYVGAGGPDYKNNRDKPE